MTEDERREIGELAADLERKRRIYQCLGEMNQRTDPVERTQAAIEYSIAQTEYLEAHAALTLAQQRIAYKGSPP